METESAYNQQATDIPDDMHTYEHIVNWLKAAQKRQQEWQRQHIGKFLISQIAEKARTQKFAGCQFLTVESLATRDYSAVGFYENCGFLPSEFKRPDKDTLRMYFTLYALE